MLARHTRELTRTEFLKSVRALSARYVERRAELDRRSPIDSAGKRAAFAAFFAPLHLLTVRAIVGALGPALPLVARIRDLGCGTGVAGAAWALAHPTTPPIDGLDHESWALTEAAWNWRALGLVGRTRRRDLVDGAVAAKPPAGPGDGIILGWSVNELPAPARDALLDGLRAAGRRGASVLVVEPLARAASPWWDAWADAMTRDGGRADEWKFDPALPEVLQSLDDAAGFRRDHLGARSLLLPGVTA